MLKVCKSIKINVTRLKRFSLEHYSFYEIDLNNCCTCGNKGDYSNKLDDIFHA